MGGSKHSTNGVGKQKLADSFTANPVIRLDQSAPRSALPGADPAQAVPPAVKAASNASSTLNGCRAEGVVAAPCQVSDRLSADGEVILRRMEGQSNSPA